MEYLNHIILSILRNHVHRLFVQFSLITFYGLNVRQSEDECNYHLRWLYSLLSYRSCLSSFPGNTYEYRNKKHLSLHQAVGDNTSIIHDQHQIQPLPQLRKQVVGHQADCRFQISHLIILEVFFCPRCNQS